MLSSKQRISNTQYMFLLIKNLAPGLVLKVF